MRIICLLIVTIVIPTVVLADEMPERKPGLWEMTMENDRQGSRPVVMKQCIDEQTDRRMQEFGPVMGNQSRSTCSKKEYRREGDRYISDLECEFQGTKSKIHSELSGDFSAAYRGETRTTFDPPMLGLASMTSKASGKYLGPCAPGQKPGDFLMPGGHTFNVEAMMKGPMGGRRP